MDFKLKINQYPCKCGVVTRSVKAMLNHMVCCREQVTQQCYCGWTIDRFDAEAHLKECSWLGKFGCTLCTGEFKDIVSANNHAWSAHGTGRYTPELQDTVVFKRPRLEAQVGVKTRYDHMTIQQLRDKCSNNKSRRLILSQLIIESDFHLPNSKFLSLLVRDAAPCFEKVGRLRKFGIKLGDRTVHVIINLDEERGYDVWRRCAQFRILDAHMFGVTVTHKHDHVIGDEQLSSLVSQVTRLLESWNQEAPVAQKLISIILKFVACARSGFDYVVTGALITDMLMNCGFTPTLATQVCGDVVRRCIAIVHEITGGLMAQAGTESLLTVFGIIFGAMALKKLPEPSQLSGLVAGATKLGMLARGVSFAWDAIERLLHYTIGKVHEWYTGTPSTIEEIEALVAGTQAWYKQVQSYVALEIGDNIGKDAHLCRELEICYNEGLRLKSKIQDYKLDQKTVSAFNEHFRFLSGLFEKAQGSGAFREGPRFEPLVIYVYGGTGVGKSALVWPLCQDLLKADGGYDVKNFMKYVYQRRVEQDFWDNYRSQPIVVYDDFAQIVDSAANPNVEFIEIIRTSNISPYPLHMASLEEKNKTNFTSKVVLCTSNASPHRLRPPSLICPDAFRRRIDICAEIRVKQQYAKRDGMGNLRVDPSAVRRDLGVDFSERIYEIQITDAMTGDNIGHPLSYAHFQDYVCLRYRNRIGRVEKFRSFLDARADVPLDAQIDESQARMCRIEGVSVVMKEPREVFEGFQWDDFRMLNRAMVLGQCEIFSEPFIEAFQNAMQFGELDYMNEMIRDFEDDIYCDGVGKVVVDHVNNEWQNHWNKFAIPWSQTLVQLSRFIDRVEIPRVRELNRVLLYLSDLSEQCASKMKVWRDKASQLVNSSPVLYYLTTHIALVGAFWAIFEVLKGVKWIWRKFSGRTHDKYPPLGVNHAGLPIGSRQLHAHKCTHCDAYFMHTHEIKSVLESRKYPQMCMQCLAKFFPQEEHGMQVDSYGNSFFLKNGVVIKRSPQAVQTEFLDELVEMSSGDPVTTIGKKVEVEMSSGDPVTVTQTKARVEMSSGDPITVTQTRARVEMSSGDPSTTTTSKTTVEGLDAELAMDPNSTLVAKKVINNMYRIELELDGKFTIRMNLVMIVGRVGLTAGHLLYYLKMASRVKISNFTKKEGHIFSTKDLKFQRVVGRDGEEKDQLLIEFPNSLHDHPSLMGSISTSISMSKFFTLKGALVTLFDNGPCIKYGDVTACDSGERQYRDNENNHYRVRDRYEYNELETTKGDCGSLLMAVSPHISEKILGIHICGTTGLGVSSPLNKNQILKALANLSRDSQVEMLMDDLVTQVKVCGEVELPEGNFTPVGIIDKKVGGPTKTKLRPSVISGKVTEPITAPSALRPVRVGDVLVDPMMEGLKKAGSIPPVLDQYMLKAASNSFKNVILANAKEEHRRILSYAESVAGVENQEFIGPVRRQTSPGYPWVQKNPGIGKHHWLGSDENYKLDDEISDLMDKRILAAWNNKRLPTVWIDTLKDERRPIEKVKAGKTRVFSAGNFEFLLTFRIFFAGFFAHMAENRIDNEISVGTNPYSYDWTRTVKKVTQKGKKVIAGDFSNYDGTLIIDILHEILEIIQEFYDDEYYEVRRILWREIVNSVHLLGDVLYLWTHSQPSGCPITAGLNSMYNSISVRYVWQLVVPPELKAMAHFERHVSMVSYGDDNIINVSDDAIGVFNQNTIAEGYGQIGMTYTDEQKSAAVVDFRSIEEISYLKRAFRWDEDTMEYVAPLQLETVLEMMNWIRGDLDQEESTIENIETACFELHLHGEDVFNYWVPKIRSAVIGLKKLPTIRTFREYQMLELDKYGKMFLLHAQVEVQKKPRSCVEEIVEELIEISQIRKVAKRQAYVHDFWTVFMTFWLIYAFRLGFIVDVLFTTLYKNNRMFRRMTNFLTLFVLASKICLMIWTMPKTLPPQTPLQWFIEISSKGQSSIAVDALQQSPVWSGFNPEESSRLLANVCLHKYRILARRVDNQEVRLSLEECLIQSVASMKEDKQDDIVEQQQITRFADDVRPETYEKPLMGVPDVFTAGQETMEHSIRSILSRPHLVAQGDFSTTGWTDKVISFPTALFSSPNVVAKLNYFNYLRADIRVRLQFNATPFQQGRYWMFFSPYDTLSNRKYNSSLQNRTGYPGVEIDIANGAPVELSIPYCAPMSHYGLVTEESTMGDLVVTKIVDLEAGDTGNDAVYQVYAWFENIHLSMPTSQPVTVPTLLEAQVGEEQAMSQKGIISAPASSVANMASMVRGTVAALSYPVEWIARTISNASANVGFNKPSSVSENVNIQNVAGKGYTQMDGLDQSVKLAAIPDNKLTSNQPFFSTDKDEMEIAYVVKKSCICSPNIEWNAMQTTGTVLYYWQNSPGCFHTQSGATVTPTTLNFVASMFENWRGSLKYRLVVTKTAFHSGRIRISFVPHGKTTSYNGNLEYCHNWILDLSKSSELEFTVPYVSNRPWLSAKLLNRVGTGWNKSTEVLRTGTLIFEVLTPLRVASSSVAPHVWLTLWHSGTDELEFAIPSFSRYVVRDATVAEDEVLEAQVFNETDEAIRHNEQMVNTSANMFEASNLGMDAAASCVGEKVTSLRQLIKRFGAYVRGNPYPYRANVGTPYSTSGPFKPNDTSSNTYGLNNIRIDPAYFGSLLNDGAVPVTANLPSQVGDDLTVTTTSFDVARTLDNNVPLHYVSYLYRFWRGSKRYKLFVAPMKRSVVSSAAWAVPSNNANPVAATQQLRTIGYETQRVSTPFVVKRSRDVTVNGTIFPTQLTSNQTVQPGANFETTVYPDLNGCIEFEVPYYSTIPISIVGERTMADTNGLLVARNLIDVTCGFNSESLDTPYPQLTENFVSQGATYCCRDSVGEFRLFTAAGDDFSFGYLVGAPRIIDFSFV